MQNVLQRQSPDITPPSSTLLNGLLRWYDMETLATPDATGGPDVPPVGTPVIAPTSAPDGGPCIDTNAGGFRLPGQAFFETSVTIASYAYRANFNITQTRRCFSLGFNDVGGNHIQQGNINTDCFGRVRTDQGINVIPQFPFTQDAWHSIITVWNGTTQTIFLYLDGVAVNVIPIGQDIQTQGSAFVSIGVRASSDQFWFGFVSTTAHWDRALSQAEVTEFHNGGVNLKYADLGA